MTENPATADEYFAREYLARMEATTVNPVLLRAIRTARAEIALREECMSDHAKTTDVRDGGCLVCDECDGDEGHDDPHDCGHHEHDWIEWVRPAVLRDSLGTVIGQAGIVVQRLGGTDQPVLSGWWRTCRTCSAEERS